MRRPVLSSMCAALLTTGATVSAVACSSLKSAESSSPPEAADGAAAPDGTGGETVSDGGIALGDAAQREGGETVCTETSCPPAIVQKGLYGPVSVAVDATHVYWIEVASTIPGAGGSGQLVRLPKTAACVSRNCFDVLDYGVLTGELEGQYLFETHVAVGPNDICYAQSFNATAAHTIRCFALAAPDVRVLDEGDGYVLDLWVGAGSARWVTANRTGPAPPGGVFARTLQNGAIETVASARVGPSAITSDGDHIYWTETGAAAPQGIVATAGSDGGVVTLAAGRSAPTVVQIYASYLYWLEPSARQVFRMRVDGATTPEPLAATDASPFALVVDASGVYWLSAGTGNNGLYGSLAHAPLSTGGNVTTMITNIDRASSLAIDGTSVYVASLGAELEDGTIVRIAKTH